MTEDLSALASTAGNHGGWVAVLLVAIRIGAMLSVAPIFGPKTTPWRIKIALGVALTFMVAPSHWHASASMPSMTSTDPVQVVAWSCREAAVGLALGLAVLLIAAGVQIASQLTGDAIGFQRSWIHGESNEPAGRMVELTTFALLLAGGGHRLAIDALLSTFQTIPPQATGWVDLQAVVELARHSFAFGLRAAAPIIAATIAARLLLAILHRIQPTLRQAAVEPTATVLAGVGIWLLCLGTVGLLALDQLELIFSEVQEIFHTGGA